MIKNQITNSLLEDIVAAVNKRVGFGREEIDRAEKADIEEDISFIKARFYDAAEKIRSVREKTDIYLVFCQKEGIRPDKSGVRAIDEIEALVKERLKACGAIFLSADMPIDEYSKKKIEYLNEYRAILHLILSASLVLDRCSPAYNQSLDATFFEVNQTRIPTHKNTLYSRNRTSHLLVALENQIREVLGFADKDCCFLVTSSAMAAYTLIERYLIQHVLKPGDLILSPPNGIYIEARCELEGLKPLYRVEYLSTYDSKEIVRIIEEKKPKVVFLDAIEAAATMRVIDVEVVIKAIAAKERNEDIFFVIDGTLISGELNPFKWINGNPQVHIFYYTSLTKYLQLGFDLVMAGFLAADVSLREILERTRARTGAAPYEFVINIFPGYTPDIFKKRMQRISRNALLVSRHITKDPALSSKVSVYYPGLESHPDFKTAEKHEFIGGLLFLVFKDHRLNNHEALNEFIDDVFLPLAKRYGVSAAKSDSFGFTIPRFFSSGFAIPRNNSPFGSSTAASRVSIGDYTYRETCLLAHIIAEALEQFTGGR